MMLLLLLLTLLLVLLLALRKSPTPPEIPLVLHSATAPGKTHPQLQRQQQQQCATSSHYLKYFSNSSSVSFSGSSKYLLNLAILPSEIRRYQVPTLLEFPRSLEFQTRFQLSLEIINRTHCRIIRLLQKCVRMVMFHLAEILVKTYMCSVFALKTQCSILG